jgi:hypothetical protein
VVLDHDDGVALFDQGMEDFDQLFAVAEVQADRGLFEEVEVADGDAAAALFVAREAVGEFGHEFEALGFAAGEGRGALAEGEVAESAIDHELADLGELRVEVEEGGGFFEGELEDLADVFAFPLDVGELGAVAGAAAVVAGEVGVGHEGHLELDAAAAGAGFAASAGGVE